MVIYPNLPHQNSTVGVHGLCSVHGLFVIHTLVLIQFGTHHILTMSCVHRHNYTYLRHHTIIYQTSSYRLVKSRERGDFDVEGIETVELVSPGVCVCICIFVCSVSHVHSYFISKADSYL